MNTYESLKSMLENAKHVSIFECTIARLFVVKPSDTIEFIKEFNHWNEQNGVEYNLHMCPNEVIVLYPW